MGIRNIYDDAPLVGMTQGSIINGCISESFPKEEVFGLIVTPRCDLSHVGKVTTVHYVPAVPFDRWFDVVARPDIKRVWKKDIESKLGNLFNSAGVGAEIMNAQFSYEDLSKICETKVTKPKTRTEIVQLLEAFYDKDDDAFDYFLLGEGKNKNKHKLTDYLSRLEGNGIAAYYVIEAWPECGCDHLVLMLRDVRRLQFDIAMRIKVGVTFGEISSLDQNSNDLLWTQDNKEFLCVQAQVASPFIEHIMQAFVYNFSRIGVEDRPGDTIDKMYSAIKNTIK